MIQDLFDFGTHMRAGILAIAITGLLFWLNCDNISLRLLAATMLQALTFVTAVFLLGLFLNV